MRKTGGILLSVLFAVAVVTGACSDDDEDETTNTTATTISSSQTSRAPQGVTSTSIAGAITTVQ